MGQVLVLGVLSGGIYALFAVGIVLVYRGSRVLNFAQGEVYMVGAFIGFGVLSGLGGPAALAVPVPLALMLMFAAAALGSGVLSVAIERIAFRPLREASRIAPLITALGVSVFLQNAVLLLLGPDIRNYDASSFIPFTSGIHVGPLNISLIRIIVIVTTVVVMVALTLWVGRSTLGRKMRAVSFDREGAQMIGIDVDRTIMIAFFVGGMLAGIAGVMAGLVFSRVFQLMGFVAGLKAFTAAVLGGIGNTTGAALGGFFIGFVEVYSAQFGLFRWSEALVFAVLILVLVFRPSGLLGERVGDRA